MAKENISLYYLINPQQHPESCHYHSFIGEEVETRKVKSPASVNILVVMCGEAGCGLDDLLSSDPLCFQSDDAGVLVGETGQRAPANQTSPFGSSCDWSKPRDQDHR